MERTFKVKIKHLRADAFCVPVECEGSLGLAVEALDWAQHVRFDRPWSAATELEFAASHFRRLADMCDRLARATP